MNTDKKLFFVFFVPFVVKDFDCEVKDGNSES